MMTTTDDNDEEIYFQVSIPLPEYHINLEIEENLKGFLNKLRLYPNLSESEKINYFTITKCLKCFKDFQWTADLEEHFAYRHFRSLKFLCCDRTYNIYNIGGHIDDHLQVNVLFRDPPPLIDLSTVMDLSLLEDQKSATIKPQASPKKNYSYFKWFLLSKFEGKVMDKLKNAW